MEHRTRSRQNYSSECERKAPELPSFPSDCDYRVFKVRQVKSGGVHLAPNSTDRPPHAHSAILPEEARRSHHSPCMPPVSFSRTRRSHTPDGSPKSTLLAGWTSVRACMAHDSRRKIAGP